MGLNNLVRAAMFSAMGIGIGYVFMLVPNIEFLTFTVFLAGLTLGLRWGLIVGLVTEFLFSALNPMGSGLMFPPMIIFQTVGMTIVGGTGGLVRGRFFQSEFSRSKKIQLGLLGFVLTFIFDSLTTLSFPLASGFDAPQTLGVYLSGLGFTVIHQISNATIFALGTPRMVTAIRK
ncbi:MAG: ECF transporter S component [FCB group bacterium]|nr:ECF transporter S component [FCB group bacterium]